MFFSVKLNEKSSPIVTFEEHASTEANRMANWRDRVNKRFECELPIIYKYFNPDNFLDEFKIGEGTAYNYSLNGMSFETTKQIPQNIPVYIKAQNNSVSGFDAHEGHHAEVKWCKEKDNKFGSYYSIGVQFYEPLTHSNKCITWFYDYQ